MFISYTTAPHNTSHQIVLLLNGSKRQTSMGDRLKAKKKKDHLKAVLGHGCCPMPVTYQRIKDCIKCSVISFRDIYFIHLLHCQQSIYYIIVLFLFIKSYVFPDSFLPQTSLLFLTYVTLFNRQIHLFIQVLKHNIICKPRFHQMFITLPTNFKK